MFLKSICLQYLRGTWFGRMILLLKIKYKHLYQLLFCWGVTIFHLHWHLFITNNAKVFTLRAYKDKRVMVGICQYHYRVTKISCKDRTQSELSLSWYYDVKRVCARVARFFCSRIPNFQQLDAKIKYEIPNFLWFL